MRWAYFRRGAVGKVSIDCVIMCVCYELSYRMTVESAVKASRMTVEKYQ